MVRRTTLAGAAVAALAVLAGCGGIDHSMIDDTTGAPGSDSSFLDAPTCMVHTGVAIAFTARVWTHDFLGNASQQTDGIDVKVDDPGVLHVARVTSDSTKFVVWGVAPGTAKLRITYNDETALTSTVTVTDQ
jgi:hypothetical protein